MAIIKCPECQNEISDKAAACPKCGCPIKEDIHFTEKQHREEQAVRDGMKYAEGMERYKIEQARKYRKAALIMVVVGLVAYVLFLLWLLASCS